MKMLVVAGVLTFAFFGVAHGQSLKLSAGDSRAIQSCIKEKESKNEGAERCIGIIADPCLDTADGQTTVGQSECYNREHLVWDDILNETYRRLQNQLDGKLKTGLRDVQRAWIESRKLQCGFYREVIQGTLATPLGASCMNTETARRALYLLGILNI